MSGSNHDALKASSHNNRSRWLPVESGNYTQRRRCGGNDAVVLEELELRNAQALSARSYSMLDAKKSALGAREPFEDVKPAGTGPR